MKRKCLCVCKVKEKERKKCSGQCNPRNQCPKNNNGNKGDNVSSGSPEICKTEMKKKSYCITRKNQSPTVNPSKVFTSQKLRNQIDKTLKKSARDRIELMEINNSSPAVLSSTGIVKKISLIFSSQYFKCFLTILLLTFAWIFLTYIAWNQAWYQNFSALQICGIATIVFWRATGSLPF